MLRDSLDQEPARERFPKGRASAAWLHTGLEVGDPGHPRNPYGARGGFSKPPLPQIWAQQRRVRNNIRFTPFPGEKEGERERVQLQPSDPSGSRRWLANLSLG